MSRVLFLAANLCSGGAERQMVTVACLLKERGHDVIVYCYDSADFYADILTRAGVPIVWELTPHNYLKRIIKVRRFIRNGNYDAVISFLQTCNFLNNISAIGGKQWRVITGERSANESFFHSKKGKIFCFAQRYADAIVCNSENATTLWKRYCPKLSSKLHVIYNSVKLGKIHSTYVPLRDGKVHYLIAATYQEVKNARGLIEALNLMSTEEKSRVIIDWYGRIHMGFGEDTRAYDAAKSLLEKYNLSDVLQLHDDTKDIADLMYQSDVVMLLSKHEGLPNTICEAMTIGKPVVMTRVSDYNILINANNGYLCDSNNFESIKFAIVSMSVKNFDEIEKMGVESKKIASNLFASDKVTRQWESVING